MCVLHVSSKSKSFADFLKKSTLSAYRCHEKGDAFLSGKQPPWEDYGFSCRIHGNIIVQCDYMLPEFLRLAGDLGIGVELSHYPNTEDDEEGTRDDS
jgi:hypothetical protein